MKTTTETPVPATDDWLGPRQAVWVFLAFALAYFLSALVRSITATFSPLLGAELAPSAIDLGLLAGGYFFGFALTQLPLGAWLDRHGPRRAILAFLGLAVLGCAAFALATSFSGLLVARVLTGLRRWLSPSTQMRANSVWRKARPASQVASPAVGYRDIWRHPYFRQMLPTGFFNYGGMVKVAG